MEKERRSSHRHEVNPNTNAVYVYHQGRRIHRCSLMDISKTGVCIGTCEFALPLGSRVNLLFVLDHAGYTRIIRKDALVTRKGPEGTGLELVRAAGSGHSQGQGDSRSA